MTVLHDTAVISFHIGQHEGRGAGPAWEPVVGLARSADPACAYHRALGPWRAQAVPTAAGGASGKCRARASARSAKTEARSAQTETRPRAAPTGSQGRKAARTEG